MPDATKTADPAPVTELLLSWIGRRVDASGLEWLTAQRDAIAGGAPDWKFFASFSAVPRYTGKADLALTAEEAAAAERTRPGWQPGRWSVDQAGRTLLLLSAPHDDPDAYLRRLDQLFDTADVGEAVALYQALPLYPFPDRLRARTAEGLRTNMTSVFAAIAHRNPFPAEQLGEAAWNQMVLKALFVGIPLHPIVGLDRRANAALARMLVDYAHERWAASRSVSPELWRPVAPFAATSVLGPSILDDLARVVASGDPAEREAGALALHRSPDPAAAEFLGRHPELAERVRGGALTWETLARDRLQAGA